MNHFPQQKQQSQRNMQMGSGLTRYRSAPSSFFSSFLNNPGDGGGFGDDDFAQLFNPRASSPETQRIFARFMNSADNIQENSSQNTNLQSQPHTQVNSQFLPPKIEPETEPEKPQQQLQRQQSNDYSSVSQMMYQNHSSGTANYAIDSSYNKQLSSFNSNREAQIKMECGGGGGGNHSLLRQSSSPAGLFANINIERDFGAVRNFEARNIPNAEVGTFPSASRFNTPMAPIPEIKGENNSVDGLFDPINPWDDSAIISDDFLKELVEDELKPSASDENQSNEGGNRRLPRLSHHMSLPQSTMEKLLQDSVPCKLRAKRGCATHPRSVAERVRRTKISERMRKLQELVPNMEKQTNTSDMLDFAVDYIKDLQTQLKTLSDSRAKCSCSTTKKS